MEASTGIHRPWIVDVIKHSLLEIPSLADNLISQQFLKFPFSRMWHIVLEEVLNVYKWRATCIFHLWFTSWTLVKVLLNLILTIFYTCSATPVITSCSMDLWKCLLNSFLSTLVNTMVWLVDYKCKIFIKSTQV